MPRIEAPTVREHHDRRRQRLLEAARGCLLDPAIRSIGFEHVGPRAGIRRNSVYLYFPSETHLYVALAEEDIPVFAEELAAAAHREEGDGAFAAIVDTTLAKVPRAEFEVLRRLAVRSTSQQADLARARLVELRDQLAEPLARLLGERGASEPMLSARLALGILEAACDAIVEGKDAHAVRTAAVEAMSRLARP
jgi:AcrR family transcriptional regulator